MVKDKDNTAIRHLMVVHIANYEKYFKNPDMYEYISNHYAYAYLNEIG